MSSTNPIQRINKTQNFLLIKGKTRLVPVKLTASVAVEDGSVLYPDPGNAGQYTKWDATAGGKFVIIRRTVATTDDDFASVKEVLVEEPMEASVEFEFTVTWTFTAAAVGTYVDLSDEKTVNVDASAKKVVFITGFINSTRGRGSFAGNVSAWTAMPVTS